MNRRGFLQAILASATAPYVVTSAGVLMPVRKLVTIDLPYTQEYLGPFISSPVRTLRWIVPQNFQLYKAAGWNVYPNISAALPNSSNEYAILMVLSNER